MSPVFHTLLNHPHRSLITAVVLVQLISMADFTIRNELQHLSTVFPHHTNRLLRLFM